MTFLNTAKDALDAAVNTLSCVAQDLVEKNRKKAKLNRIRMKMKSESELMNRAYIVLGKEYYAILKKGDAQPTEKPEKLVEVIDNCKAKIAKARICYLRILEDKQDYKDSDPAERANVRRENVVDITVACSNESDYQSSPFSQAGEAVKETANEVTEAVEEKVDEVKEAAEEKADEIKEAAEEKVDEEFPEGELF